MLTEQSITGHTGLTCLLGSPVAHSLSPLMHNMAFHLLSLDYVYLCFDVKEDRLPDAVAGLKAIGVRGFNLTMPNKNKMVELCDHLSPAAALTGAVNTVVNENGILYGHNTDGAGFIRAAKEKGCQIAGQTITILGAGGAASAVCAQAALDGAAAIRIFARTSSRFYARTENLAQRISSETACQMRLLDLADTDVLRQSIAESSLLVNATPVGMAPDTAHSLITDPAWLTSELTVADLIYNPRKTRLLQIAADAGCHTFNGLGMLLYQGAEAFRLWTGQDMPVAPIREKYFA